MVGSKFVGCWTLAGFYMDVFGRLFAWSSAWSIVAGWLIIGGGGWLVGRLVVG